jgi:elongation factor Ts
MSNQTDLIKQLRELTSAGMKDCKDALTESNWDIQSAIDIIKVKGLNIADGRTGRVAAEGLVNIASWHGGNDLTVMLEINSQTDFVANSQDFKSFMKYTTDTLCQKLDDFQVSDVENIRQGVVATTKENIVVRRWCIRRTPDLTTKVFSYLHSNEKIGVLLTMRTTSKELADDPKFQELGNDLSMQVCAMNPLAVSPDQLSQEDKSRQEAIFRTQLAEDKKPEKMWDKIIEGKFNRWFKDVCLLEQESVVVPKTTVKQVISNVGTTLGGDIKVLSFVRYQVGEGIDVKKDNLTKEVAKLMKEEA